MPRKKSYIEEEVIEKAMHTFWKKGYEATSVRDLEREMGINQFSIYASFTNKDGIFLESVKYYKTKATKEILNKLINSNDGVNSIKKYFKDFLKFVKDTEGYKGCLLTNTINELGGKANEQVVNEIGQFSTLIRDTFFKKLATNTIKSKETINKQANYLIVALQGLSVASKMLGKKQLDDFIEVTFKNI